MRERGSPITEQPRQCHRDSFVRSRRALECMDGLAFEKSVVYVRFTSPERHVWRPCGPPDELRWLRRMVRRQMMRRGDGRRAQRAAEEDELPLGCI